MIGKRKMKLFKVKWRDFEEYDVINCLKLVGKEGLFGSFLK